MAEQRMNSDIVTRGEWVERIGQITGTAQAQAKNAEQNLSRVEAAVLLADALPGLNTGIAGNMMPPYTDIAGLSDAEKDSVRYLYHTGIMFGYGDMTFKPHQFLNRSVGDDTLARAQQRVQAQKPAVPYEEVSDVDALPQAGFDEANKALGSPGVRVVQTDTATYAIISAGERPSAGYELEAYSVVQGKGQIEILVGMRAPDPDLMVAQMITYPQLVLKLQPTQQPIVVVNPESLQ